MVGDDGCVIFSELTHLSYFNMLSSELISSLSSGSQALLCSELGVS